MDNMHIQTGIVKGNRQKKIGPGISYPKAYLKTPCKIWKMVAVGLQNAAKYKQLSATCI